MTTTTAAENETTATTEAAVGVLKKLRENLGVSRVDLAEKMSLTEEDIELIESQIVDSVGVFLIRDYIEALGGKVIVEMVFPKSRVLLEKFSSEGVSLQSP